MALQRMTWFLNQNDVDVIMRDNTGLTTLHYLAELLNDVRGQDGVGQITS